MKKVQRGTSNNIDLWPVNTGTILHKTNNNCHWHKKTMVTNWLTRWSTVFTTSLLVTWPTSTSPMSTPNFKLSVAAIVTTWSGLLMSPNAVGFIGSSIGKAVCGAWYTPTAYLYNIYSALRTNTTGVDNRFPNGKFT